MEKKIVTDKEAAKAMNMLIDYCRYPRLCSLCVLKKNCMTMEEGSTCFGELDRIEEADEMPNRIEAEKLAPNMAASIMNRKD